MFSNKKTDEIFKKCAVLVRDYLSKFPYDIIHTSGSEAGFIMSLVRKSGLRIPWVHTNYATLTVRRVMTQNSSPAQAFSDSIARRELLSLQQCDCVIALSDVDKWEISSVFGIDKSKINVVNPGVDHSVFFWGRKHDRKPIVISAGRMSDVKDFPFLLRSFRLVINQMYDIKPTLVIVGGNRLERDKLGLLKQIENLNLQHQVRFLDGMDQKILAQYFRQAKVFVGSSRHETFGLLPVEARACGTPSVVRSNSSYISAVKNGYGGYFVDNEHEQDMADKIAYILSLGNNQWRKMSREALMSVQQYTWPRMAQGCIKVYKNIGNLSRKI